MKKIIKVKETKEGELYLDLKDFREFIDINKVDSYEFICYNKTAVIIFYDEDGNRLEIKEIKK